MLFPIRQKGRACIGASSSSDDLSPDSKRAFHDEVRLVQPDLSTSIEPWKSDLVETNGSVKGLGRGSERVEDSSRIDRGVVIYETAT